MSVMMLSYSPSNKYPIFQFACMTLDSSYATFPFTIITRILIHSRLTSPWSFWSNRAILRLMQASLFAFSCSFVSLAQNKPPYHIHALYSLFILLSLRYYMYSVHKTIRLFDISDAPIVAFRLHGALCVK